MALIKCPECGKEVSDKAPTCPHCGCPLSDELVIERATKTLNTDQEEVTNCKKQKVKKTFSRKKKFTFVTIVGVVIIGGVLGFFLTKNLRYYNMAMEKFKAENYESAAEAFKELGSYKDSDMHYQDSIFQQAKIYFDNKDYQNAIDKLNSIKDSEKAQDLLVKSKYNLAKSLYESVKYDEALIVFKEISKYEDSKKFIKDCEYQLSIDGQFMKALSKGLMDRWDYNEDESKMDVSEVKNYRKKLVNCELDYISKFGDETFKDEELKKAASEYINALNEQLKAVDYYGIDDNRYSEEWDKGLNSRSLLIKKFVEKYNLLVDDAYQTNISEFVTQAGIIVEQENIKEQVSRMIDVKFDEVKNSYGYKTYEATISNITNVTFSYFGVMVNLYDENDVIIESPYANPIQNFESGQKAKISFSTQKDFKRMEYVATYY